LVLTFIHDFQKQPYRGGTMNVIYSHIIYNKKLLPLPTCTARRSFLLFRKNFSFVYSYGFELSHDVVPASRSDDNRRAAGAVDHSACCSIMPPKKSSGDDRPGGEAFSVIRVFCGAFNQKIFVLPSFIFLFFHKDFLYCYELSHDTIPASRSDDNRRAAGAADRSACCSIMPPKNLQETLGPAARHSV